MSGPSSSRSSSRSVGWITLGVGVVLVSVTAAAFAVAFRWSLGAVPNALTGAGDVVSAMRALPVWARALAPAIGGLLAGLVGVLVSRSPGGHGVGDVMEAVVMGRVRLSARVTLLKSLASWLAISFGGSLGREGPLIQVGGAAGKLWSARLRLPLDATRILVAAGTASGFAAAYNTPFAAVLFVFEIVLGLALLDAMIPVLVATGIATTLTRLVVGAGPIYGERTFAIERPAELISFVGLGIVGAFGGQLFMRSLTLGERLFRHPRLDLPLRPALGGALAGAIVAFLPEVAGNGYEPLNTLLDGRLAIGFVLLLLLGKVLATTASVSSGSPGGVFTPTLLVGGCIGALYAAALSAVGVSVGPAGGYVLVGMAASTAATTHAPLMAAVMAFELSGDYAIVLPLLLATAVATAISRRLRRDSIYTAELRARGIDWDLTWEGRRASASEAVARDGANPP